MLKLAPLTMFITMPRMLNAATMTPHTIRFLEFSLLLLCFTPLIPAISWQMPPTSVKTSHAQYENVKPEAPPSPAASAPNPPRKTPAKTENTAAMIIKMPVIFKNLFPFMIGPPSFLLRVFFCSTRCGLPCSAQYTAV